MSQYRPKPKDPNHLVLIGWDPPLNTFFAHVIDESKDEDDDQRDVLWIGCRYKECHSLEDVISKIKPYVNLTHEEHKDLVRKLTIDSD